MSDRKTNDEFRQLYEASNMRKEDIANALGASLHTVLSWTKSQKSKSSCECPKWRVDMMKIIMPPGTFKLSNETRSAIYGMLKTLREAGVMSKETIAAFAKLSADDAVS